MTAVHVALVTPPRYALAAGGIRVLLCSSPACARAAAYVPQFKVATLYGYPEEPRWWEVPIGVAICRDCKEACPPPAILLDAAWDIITAALRQHTAGPPVRVGATLTFARIKGDRETASVLARAEPAGRG